MFEEIYSWFTQFCCNQETVRGLATLVYDDGSVANTGAYLPLGIWTLVVSFLLCFAFYIWPLDHPRFKAWWAWLTTAGVNSLLAFLIGLIYSRHHLNDINGDEDLVSLINSYSDELFPYSFGDYVSVGLANIFVALLFFIFFSLCLNWFGKSTKYSPFRK